MKFYTQTHQHYCGIDLHARSLYVCITDSRRRRRRQQDRAAYALWFQEFSLQWQIHVGNNVFFPHIGSDIDIVKDHREIAGRFTTLRQPRFVQKSSRLVIRAGANVSGTCASERRNYLVYDAIGIGTNIFVKRKTEIGPVLGWWSIARIRVVNAIASVL